MSDIIEKELEAIKGKRKELKIEAKYIKQMLAGGHHYDTIVPETNVRKLVRILNEKFNHRMLECGEAEFQGDDYLFTQDDEYQIVFDSPDSGKVVIHSLGAPADTFVAMYNYSIKKLNESLKSEEDIAFYSKF